MNTLVQKQEKLQIKSNQIKAQVITGIKINYPHINLKKKQDIGTVQYNNRIYMTVLVDVQSNTYKVKGSVENILPITKVILISTIRNLYNLYLLKRFNF
ncbi:hypothetical protein [Viridibacillus arvi]|uniref:hypothetical protein n=1 Tax=Viridibacillus arvi TaxID=263475 RepID=UPI003D037113